MKGTKRWKIKVNRKVDENGKNLADLVVGKLNTLQSQKAQKRAETWRKIKKNNMIYLMITPGLIFFLIYKYISIYGLIIAFQDYKPYQGILGSEWVGIKHFERLFTCAD